MASLSTLAEDIMHGICEYLTPRDIFQLTLTQKRFATSFERSLLLHRDLASQTYTAMLAAIIRNEVDRVEELLQLGYEAKFACSRSLLACPADFDFPVNNLMLQAPSNVAIRRQGLAALVIERLYRPACDTHKIWINYSVLAHAILEDQVETVRLLHKYGADLEKPLLQVFAFRGMPADVDHHISVLHLASSSAMIETLLELAPNIPIDKDRFMRTEPLLLWHVERGTDVRGLRRLLEAGAHVDGARPATQRIGFCQCEQEDTLHVFLDHKSPLEAAIWNLDRDAVELLLEHGASTVYPPNDTGEATCLHEAIRIFLLEHKPEDLEVSLQIFRLLLDHGFDVNHEYIEWAGWTPEGTRLQPTGTRINLVVDSLIYYASTEMFQLLLDAGADPFNASGVRPGDKSYVVMLGLSSSVARLYPTNMTEPERVSLQSAKLKALIAKRAESDPSGRDRRLLFMAALEISRPSELHQVFKVLQKVFGSFEEELSLLADTMGRVKMIPGVLQESRQIIEFLIRCRAPVNHPNSDGETPLHVAYTLSIASPLPIGETDDLLAWDVDEEQGFTVGWAIGTNNFFGHETINGFLGSIISAPAEAEKRVRNANAIFDALIQAGAAQNLLNEKGETAAMVMAQHDYLDQALGEVSAHDLLATSDFIAERRCGTGGDLSVAPFRTAITGLAAHPPTKIGKAPFARLSARSGPTSVTALHLTSTALWRASLDILGISRGPLVISACFAGLKDVAVHLLSSNEHLSDFNNHQSRLPAAESSAFTCDETRPECLACVKKGVKCSGYERPVTFRDVTTRAAESSRKFEEARWAALRLEDERRKRRRIGSIGEPSPVARESSTPENITEMPARDDTLTAPILAPMSPWHATNAEGWLAGSFTLPWSLFDTSGASSAIQDPPQQQQEVARPRDTSSGIEQPTTFENSANRLMLASGVPNSSAPVAEAPSLALTTGWDEFLVTDRSSPGSSTSTSSPLGEPTADCQLSIPLEEVLIQHFDRNVLPLIPVALSFPNLFRQSSCFRSAVLALSASNIKLTQPLPIDPLVLRRVCDDSSVWIYYDTAVKGLQAQLQNVENYRGEELAGAALLLAYHELEAGTALGIRNHATGLDAIASKLDFAASSIPDLFKAWRMLRYDVRFMMLPTRATCNVVDNYDVSSLLDPQLAIRDILFRLHGLHARYAMEATFSQDTTADGDSASEKVALWLMSVLGRESDRRNVRLKDFHKENLTPDTILRQCDVFSHRLDNWHKGLCDHDMPVVNLGADSDLISGATFETFVTYRFGDTRKALEYVIYLVCRMTCSYLRSLFDPSVQSSGTDALAKVVLGIVCGMNMQQRQQFTVLRVDVLLRMAAGLSEGTNFITTVLDYLLPRLISSGLTGPDIVAWVYLKSALELELRERRKGRAIRMTIDGVEEDCEMWQLVNRHPVAAFGDYNGKGYFRDCYVIECLG
ncbi:hypothetical protein CABS01_13870 [Colletotrichum abscissum]|uniref:uncharacterized protein n=1 Tax=Colletotrichum abscissum TaxID=1671311 RepID=UPI0027D6CA2A|nr:uncharacterized protein CABS01_13870 [Colletotrichum abscissum]KAK1484447.1 hypothetical protein CABS01_13870 [Colletotrichum abscissum]